MEGDDGNCPATLDGAIRTYLILMAYGWYSLINRPEKFAWGWNTRMPHVTLSRKSRNPNPTAFDFIADIEPDQKSGEALDNIGVVRQPRIDRMQAHLLD